MSPPPSPPVFVVGAPRSGTTLLRRLLSQHPDVALPHELRLLDIAAAAGWSASRGGRPAPSQGGGAVSPRELALGVPLVYALLRRLSQHTGARVVGDKYPPDAARLPALAAVFAGCKVVHIIRDGRDVVSSSLKAFAERTAWRRGPTPAKPAQVAASWTHFVSAARRDSCVLGHSRYLEVSYEALLSRPLEAAAPVLAFLGVSTHPDFEAGLHELRPGKDWRKTLSAGELSACYAVPGFTELLRDLGRPVPSVQPAPEDSAHACLERARQAGSRAERVAELSRAVRAADAPDDAVIELLEESDTPASLLAAMNARERDDPRVRAAWVRWMVARGLDTQQAAALGGSPP